MGDIQGLIDEKQVALFDAFDQLSRLGSDHKMEIPQMIVVGDQSSGKSSTLEAITRFRFPTGGELCTRFPTKLILRNSSKERICLSIEPGITRTTVEEREALMKFNGSPSHLRDLSGWIDKAATELGVYSGTTSNKSASSASTSHQVLRNFTDDILRVEIDQPNLPNLDLLDLPGVFQLGKGTVTEQDRKTVEKMVEMHIQSPRNVVLFVCSAPASLENSATGPIINIMLGTDSNLLNRVVGVITQPDKATHHLPQVLNMLGAKGQINRKFGWHVVKNQDTFQNSKLETRDSEEEEFFRGKDLTTVPESQKGIKALRETLKVALWDHATRELPNLVSEVEQKLANVKAELATTDRSRSTEPDQRKYLNEIAGKFQALTREACRGTYYDERPQEFYKVGSTYKTREKFFPCVDDGRPESVDKLLRGNVRSLNEAFVRVMREFGKTKVLADQASTPGDVTDETQIPTRQEVQVQGFAARKDLQTFYGPIKRESVTITQCEFENWLNQLIERWSGQEPRGEASTALVSRLLQYQSCHWSEIAKNHLLAVWRTVETFINLALAATCNENDVLKALKKYIIDEEVEKLQKESFVKMQELLNCHAQDNTGFYDSCDVFEDQRLLDITRLASATRRFFRGKDSHHGKFVPDKVIDLLISMLGGGFTPRRVIRDIAIPTFQRLLREYAGYESVDEGGNESDHEIGEERGRQTTAARVIEHVESYYKVRWSLLLFMSPNPFARVSSNQSQPNR